MRFIGNKENLINKIHQVLEEKKIKGNSFFDFFSGTTSVARYFKKLNYQIFSCDLLYFSYVLQKAYIENNEDLKFAQLIESLEFKSSMLFATPLDLVIEYLNKLKPQEDFIFQHYTPTGSSLLEKPRMYFIDENGKIIDTIRNKIEEWKKKDLISEYSPA